MSEPADLFANAYLACAALAVVAILLRLDGRRWPAGRAASWALLFPLAMLYLVGMHRHAGVDFDSYSYAFYDQGQAIPDLGYTWLTAALRSLGFSFSDFLLLQAVFTLSVWTAVARERGADVVVVLAVYLLHLAIVRDMSQSRIGLAVAVYLLGQTRQSKLAKTLLYVAALSVHVTVAVLMLLWAFAGWAAGRSLRTRVLLVVVPIAVLAIGGTWFLGALVFVDPRIEIYLSWDEVGYGAPLESFGALARTALVLAIYAFAMRRQAIPTLRPYLIMECVGAALLIGLYEYSIFAARLSNVAITMYPIGVGLVVAALQQGRRPMGKRFFAGALSRVAVVLLCLLLLARPGSVGVLREVVPSVVTALT